MEEKTISRPFYYSIHIKNIWNQVQAYFTDWSHFLQLTPQTAIFGFHDIANDTFLIQNVKLHYSNYNARNTTLGFNRKQTKKNQLFINLER